MALLSLTPGTAVLYSFTLITFYYVSQVVYNLWFHPLAKYPGPVLLRMTRAGYCYKLFTGTLPYDVLDLHKKYGDIVRIAPDELAFANSRAWQDIQGHRTRGALEFEKFDKFYRPVDDVPLDIVNSNREEHGILRKHLSHGFSDKSLREQEPLITQYVDLLIQRLHEHGEGGAKKVNINAWLNFTTFDIIGDLAFGEAFGCLNTSGYHPWVHTIFQMARVGTVLQTANHYPIIRKIMSALAPKSALEKRDEHNEMTMAMLRRRMEFPGERPDFLESLIKSKEAWIRDPAKLQANSSILIIGGSETTATLLSGVTYLLLTNPEHLKRVTEEVRSRFKSEDEITFTSSAQLEFMLACLNEGMRRYPPVPMGLPRVTPKGGAIVCNELIPEGTIVGVHQWAMYHNDKNFKNPMKYDPNRFLGAEEYANDNRESFQPFHTGPRNCLGKNLAYNEMRVILARVLWNFDLTLDDECKDWINQKIYNLWDKGPLNVYLKPVKR